MENLINVPLLLERTPLYIFLLLLLLGAWRISCPKACKRRK